MAAPDLSAQQPNFNPDEYSKCLGLDVKVDPVNQLVFLEIHRGLELPVKVAVGFDGICLLAASVLQVVAMGPPIEDGGSLPSLGG